jgi:predicted Zn-dependent protease
MKKNSVIFSLMLLLSFCQPTPETGRKQLNLVSEEELFKLSFEQYQEYLNTHEVITGTEDAELVKNVGSNIQNAVEQYYTDNPEKLKRYRWEFNLIEDTAINAFAMPGGKVAILSPILPVTSNAAGLAFVIGTRRHPIRWLIMPTKD